MSSSPSALPPQGPLRPWAWGVCFALAGLGVVGGGLELVGLALGWPGLRWLALALAAPVLLLGLAFTFILLPWWILTRPLPAKWRPASDPATHAPDSASPAASCDRPSPSK